MTIQVAETAMVAADAERPEPTASLQDPVVDPLVHRGPEPLDPQLSIQLAVAEASVGAGQAVAISPGRAADRADQASAQYADSAPAPASGPVAAAPSGASAQAEAQMGPAQ